MGIFLVYILKSSVCLSLFYLFYRLLLSKETFHRFNRIALLGLLILSLLIPLVEVTTSHQTELSQTMLTIEQLLMMAETMDPVETVAVVQPETVSISWIQVLLLVYLTGILFFACRNFYSLSRLWLLIKSGKRQRLERGIVLIVIERDTAPFSWMKYIVISRKDLEENGREILIHEIAHIRNRHSIDLLVADICIFFQWFNPGAWLLKQELMNIHEYEADETVIKEGVNAKDYQLLLIKKAVGTRLYSMANSFNHSKLKKRITMMLKEKSSPWARLKYVYVLPLAAVAVTAFARPEISEKAEEISAVKVNDLTTLMQEKVLGDTTKVLKDTIKVSKSKAVSASKAIAIGGSVSKDNEENVVFEIVEQMPEYPGGMNALQKYLKDKTESSSVKGKAGGSVIVGFTVTETGKVKDVKASESDQSILSKEAERIVSEMSDWKPGMQRGVPVPVKYSISVRFGNVRFPENKEPLIMVDGEEVSMDAFDQIDKGVIESFSVLKDGTSISQYGNRGANGVIIINTRRKEKLSNDVKVMPFIEKRTSETNAAEEITVTGTVVDEQRRPMAGVSVVVSNSNMGATTDKDGHFSLKTSKDGHLMFSFIGYKSVKIPVSSDMLIEMEEEVVMLLPEVSGTDEKPFRVDADKNGNFILRGYKPGEHPLVIINGKEAKDKDALSKLSVSQIQSFSILKDKSATSSYGEKGKYGVVIIDLYSKKEYRAKMRNASRVNSESTKGKEDAVLDKDKEEPIVYINDTEVKGLASISTIGGYGTVREDEKTGKRIVHIYTKQ